jgi:hypothetical protein
VTFEAIYEPLAFVAIGAAIGYAAGQHPRLRDEGEWRWLNAIGGALFGASVLASGAFVLAVVLWVATNAI